MRSFKDIRIIRQALLSLQKVKYDAKNAKTQATTEPKVKELQAANLNIDNDCRSARKKYTLCSSIFTLADRQRLFRDCHSSYFEELEIARLDWRG